ncbi:PPC domain-containing DNA-binding protein [Marinifilum sp. D714]|uniref:PPC domain-containing DNA-binding protein n=1 Tax=Marinifilum sp. D714 TaxID=2937523 RepID=UPI0027CA37FD|nr:PPC domain-containing DNA-binding protein [Marinifilum sp. D714]MDQ2178933.1 DNA-binding protein [Marinifilum sp. D714]
MFKLYSSLILVAFIALFSCQPNRVESYAMRLKPGMDLKQEMAQFVKKRELQSASISTCVGSLRELKIRPANQKELLHLKGHFEIVSLSGTFADKGEHIHISVSDSTGYTIGGHLVDGNLIYTTAEIVFLNNTNIEFTREIDPETTYYELKVN